MKIFSLEMTRNYSTFSKTKNSKPDSGNNIIFSLPAGIAVPTTMKDIFL